MMREYGEWSDEEFYDWLQWVNSMKCPHDGEQLTYCDGQIGEDFQGNAEYGEWFRCDKCGYETEVHAL